MNYLKEINAFYDWLETNTISDSAIVLWHALMHINNKAGWIDTFAVAISTLETKTGLKKDAIGRARNTLAQKGRIIYSSRSGQQSAIYTIISFETSCDVLSDTNRFTNQALTAPQTASLTTPLTASINKLNETKLNIKKESKEEGPVKKSYAEFVSMTEDEYNQLLDKFGEVGTKDRIEALSLWKGSKGKSTASDYHTILNWDRMDKDKNKSKPSNKHFGEDINIPLDGFYRNMKPSNKFFKKQNDTDLSKCYDNLNEGG